MVQLSGWCTENVQMSTQTLCFLIVIICSSFDHRMWWFLLDFIMNCVHPSSDNGSQTSARPLDIHLLLLCFEGNRLFVCLFLMKKGFTCYTFKVFEHFCVCKHPFLLWQCCCCHCCTQPWRLLLLCCSWGSHCLPKAMPCSVWDSCWSTGFVSLAGISHSACPTECGSPT